MSHKNDLVSSAFTKLSEEAEAPQTVTGGFFSALAFTGNHYSSYDLSLL